MYTDNLISVQTYMSVSESVVWNLGPWTLLNETVFWTLHSSLTFCVRCKRVCEDSLPTMVGGRVGLPLWNAFVWLTLSLECGAVGTRWLEVWSRLFRLCSAGYSSHSLRGRAALPSPLYETHVWGTWGCYQTIIGMWGLCALTPNPEKSPFSLLQVALCWQCMVLCLTAHL